MSKEKAYININDVMYRVKDFESYEKCSKGNAYKIGKLVFPYFGSDKNISEEKQDAGIWISHKSNDGYIIRPLNKKKYRAEKIYYMDIDTILDIIKMEGTVPVNDTIMMADSEDAFIPEITDSDNMLQRIIKTALAKKKIDLKNYLPRFDDATQMTNYKRAMLYHGNMSMDKFLKWCDVLDISFTISYEDKYGKKTINPMNIKARVSNDPSKNFTENLDNEE